MGLGGLHTISIYNPADGTVCQINSILENEGELVVGRPFEENRNTRGESIFAGTENVLELLIDSNSTIYNQIRAWEAAGTRVRAVGAGFQRNLQWYENTLIEIMPKNHFAPGKLGGRIVRLKHNGPAPQIFANRNLLAYLGWQDANADGLADGYVTQGAGVTAVSFASNIQTISCINAFTGFRTSNIQFPISGVRLTFSSEITTVWTSGLQNIHTLNYNFTNSLIQDVGISGQNTLGIKALSIITVPSIYTIQFFPFRTTQTGVEANASFRNPAITTDGSLTPGTSFMDF
jgi:hypothetical protein